ncbi:MAG TPA: hypothetical protein VFP39_09655, partial [Gemmatimonadales bacterium]|nr:hypothetical protein [Gemmatimonadales bacterium]
MNRIRSIATALLGLAAGGCAMTFDSSHLGVPVTMASAATSPTTGTAFRVNRHPVFMGWGLVTLGAPNLEDVLAGQVANGAGVTNLKIRVRANLFAYLVTGLTFGLFSPRTVTFEGTVQGAAAPV